jgi:leukotriene-A4 hydrolase
MNMTASSPWDLHDEFSYAQPERVGVEALKLDLDLDFAAKILDGTATYTLNWKDPQCQELILDTRDLTIKHISQRQDETWISARFELGERDEVLGSALRITLSGQPDQVKIEYTTSPEASGLQWIDADATEGKRAPMVFSQSQAIHGRSWIPLQDTPLARATVDATIRTQEDTIVLMGTSNNPEAVAGKLHRFSMPHRIPSYLLALAAGDLSFARISDRCGIWAEREMASKAAAEFAEIETIMAHAEQLCGAYPWGRYDILVLPPSFPFGGMENPCLTFASPTVVVGDRSLVSLIAHELAHSWSGNLTTGATQRDLWINEGMTCYIENRLIEALYDKPRASMEASIAEQTLLRTFDEAGAEHQVLVQRPGVLVDPDDICVDTVYTKGAILLRTLEHTLGRERVDAFLQRHFARHAFKSISAQEFASDLVSDLGVDPDTLDAWLLTPGLPEGAVLAHSDILATIDAARVAWLEEGKAPAVNGWSTHEWVHFLDGLPARVSIKQAQDLDAIGSLTGTPNGEIAQRWYPLAVRSEYHDASVAMERFLVRVGRAKMIVPVYEALAQSETGRQKAQRIFSTARAGYHPITAATIEKLVHHRPRPALGA